MSHEPTPQLGIHERFRSTLPRVPGWRDVRDSKESKERVPMGDRRARDDATTLPETIECVFCPHAIESSTSPFDRVIASGTRGYIIPALGMLVPGYFLSITNRHVVSLSQLEATEIEQFYSWALKFCSEWSGTFGEYLIVEHGSCSGSYAGSCIEHAHLHLVPLQREIANVLLTDAGLSWRRLSSPSEIAKERGRGYISLAGGGSLYVARDIRVPSQWLRRVIARELSLDVWDWALEEGLDNLLRTLAVMSPRQEKVFST